MKRSEIKNIILIKKVVPYNVKRSELRFEAWKRVKNREGAVYTTVPRKLIGRLPKHSNIYYNFHRFWIGWWNKNIPYLAEKASNRPLKFSIFTCNPMEGSFSVVPPSVCLSPGFVSTPSLWPKISFHHITRAGGGLSPSQKLNSPMKWYFVQGFMESCLS